MGADPCLLRILEAVIPHTRTCAFCASSTTLPPVAPQKRLDHYPRTKRLAVVRVAVMATPARLRASSVPTARERLVASGTAGLVVEAQFLKLGVRPSRPAIDVELGEA